MLRKFMTSESGSMAVEYAVAGALIVSGLMAIQEPLARQANVFDRIAAEMNAAVKGEAAGPQVVMLDAPSR